VVLCSRHLTPLSMLSPFESLFRVLICHTLLLKLWCMLVFQYKPRESVPLAQSSCFLRVVQSVTTVQSLLRSCCHHGTTSTAPAARTSHCHRGPSEDSCLLSLCLQWSRTGRGTTDPLEFYQRREALPRTQGQLSLRTGTALGTAASDAMITRTPLQV
jgi:hypothetical protein